MITIYTLKCPFTGAIKYVGQTKYSLEARLTVHRTSPTNSLMKAWLKTLDNAPPIIEELDSVEPDEADYFEMYWIAQFKQWGFELLNKRITTPRWWKKNSSPEIVQIPPAPSPSTEMVELSIKLPIDVYDKLRKAKENSGFNPNYSMGGFLSMYISGTVDDYILDMEYLDVSVEIDNLELKIHELKNKRDVALCDILRKYGVFNQGFVIQ